MSNNGHISMLYDILSDFEPEQGLKRAALEAGIEALRRPPSPEAGGRVVLGQALEKLRLYRAAHSGEYVGGVEFTELERRIVQALAAPSVPSAGVDELNEIMAENHAAEHGLEPNPFANSQSHPTDHMADKVSRVIPPVAWRWRFRFHGDTEGQWRDWKQCTEAEAAKFRRDPAPVNGEIEVQDLYSTPAAAPQSGAVEREVSDLDCDRYFASGPEGYFYTNDLALASKLIQQSGFDEDWTVTDLHDPTGAALAASGGDGKVSP